MKIEHPPCLLSYARETRWTTKSNEFNRPRSVIKLTKVKCPQKNPLKTSSIVLMLFGCVCFPLSVFSFLFIALNLPNAPAPFVHHHQVHKSWHSVCPPHSWWESKPKKINKHSWLRTGIWNLHGGHHLPLIIAVTFSGCHCCIFVHINIPSKNPWHSISCLQIYGAKTWGFSTPLCL